MSTIQEQLDAANRRIAELESELSRRTEARDIAVRLKLAAQDKNDRLQERIAELEAALKSARKRVYP